MSRKIGCFKDKQLRINPSRRMKQKTKGALRYQYVLLLQGRQTSWRISANMSNSGCAEDSQNIEPFENGKFDLNSSLEQNETYHTDDENETE